MKHEELILALFFHGIDFKYVINQYPVLSPRCSTNGKTSEQLADRRHLIEQFGFEPVHLLESSGKSYPPSTCVKECLHYGGTVFSFSYLPIPYWQLSLHEIGVQTLDLRTCHSIYTLEPRWIKEIKNHFPNKPIFLIKNHMIKNLSNHK